MNWTFTLDSNIYPRWHSYLAFREKSEENGM
jgi:hypothetical protein